MYNLEGKVQKTLSNNETHFIVENNSVVVCPWVIRNGFQNISEEGFLPKNANPYFYGFFQKVFTGNECITATWEDSTYLTKVPNVYKFAYNFQVGKYYEGAVVVGSGEYSTEIENVENNSDFLAMKNNSMVTIRFEKWIPSEKDMYKLYTIPNLYGGKWYYISNVRVLNDLQSTLGGDNEYTLNDMSIPAVEITFTSLVDKLQQSGKAVEQYVQYGAIGEPYAIPLVFEYNENQDTENAWIEPKKYITYIPYQPQSANYLQVELQGANSISGLEVEGRKLAYEVIGQDTEGNDIYAWTSTPWKRLLAHDTVANQINEINRTSLPSRNFYFFPNETLSFATSKNFQEDVKTREDALAMNQAGGKLSMGGTSQWSSKPNGLHNSNPVTTDGTHYDYNNKSWKPFAFYSTAEAPTLSHDTSGNFYAVDTINYTANDTFVDILNKNSFIYETQPILPLGFVSSKPYHISSIPLIGKIVSKFWGDLTINPHTTQRRPISIGYFMDCDIAGMLANIYSSEQDNTVWSPLNALVGDETKASKYLGTTACNTTICVSLTDKVSESGTTYDTIYFGQRKNENNEYILGDHSPYFYGRANQITQPKNESDIFVIDSITVYALHKGKIKLTAFNNLSSSIWTTTIQSKANWTNSIRDWATTISCGGWGEEYCNFTEQDFPWPERPDKQSTGEITINYTNDWIFGDKISNVFGVYQNGYKNGFNSYQQDDYGSAGSKKGYKTCIFNRTPQTQTLTVPYSTFDHTISTKAQFKNKYGEMFLPISGSISADTIGTLSAKGFEERIVIGSADVYTRTIVICQLGQQITGNTYQILAINNSQDAMTKMKGFLRQESPYFWVDATTGGISTRITYTITLGDSDITILITENDYYLESGTKYDREYDYLFFGDFCKNIISSGKSGSISMCYNNASMKPSVSILSTKVQIPKLKIMEK